MHLSQPICTGVPFQCSYSARLDCNYSCVCVFLSLSLFFFLVQPAIVDFVHSEQCIRALFTVPQITLFSNFFIKNGSHSTIYTFKNYFVTVFLVSVFSFSKNKLNPNIPIYMNKLIMNNLFPNRSWITHQEIYSKIIRFALKSLYFLNS